MFTARLQQQLKCVYKKRLQCCSLSPQRSASSRGLRNYGMVLAATTHEEVFDYWFDPSKPEEKVPSKWFTRCPGTDNYIRKRFLDLVEKAHRGELASWEKEPKSALALIVLIDQFCRNIFRGDKRAFIYHDISLRVARKFIEGKELNHLDMRLVERYGMYLVFTHEESLEDQKLCVSLSEKLLEDAKGTPFEKIAQTGAVYSRKHMEVIEKYGRFIKRNVALGRETTPAEKEALKNYAYDF